LTPPKQPQGTFFLWSWGDREIDDPRRLKNQILEIASCGFSTVLVSFDRMRYEFIDNKVIRAIAQASQWAKKRNIDFWIQTDPRQASRSLIRHSGEYTQNLIVAPTPEQARGGKIVNVAPVQDNHFELRYNYPGERKTDVLQETALYFEPEGLERAFLFQSQNGIIVNDTVRDITPISHFFANVQEKYVEVFGDVQIPEDETWWVVAFPCFKTNHYDYAGRESNDHLHHFIENLFDGCTHLDGFTWGKDTTGYITDIGRLPVSLSFLNCFRAEYGYDLRDVLYTLILDMDDGSHIRVRYDYYTLLMKTVFNAQKDFYVMIHSFFDGLGVGTHHTLRFDRQRSRNLIQGCIDPWRSQQIIDATFFEMEKTSDTGHRYHSILASLVFSKSLGIFSKTQRAYFQLQHTMVKLKTLMYWMDLANLFSVFCVIHPTSCSDKNKSVSGSSQLKWMDTPNWKELQEYNRKVERIRTITRFHFPESNVALVFPMETIMCVGPQDGESMMQHTNSLISAGVQLDVISPILLKEGSLSPQGLRIQDRVYEIIIFPYPEVLDPAVLETISLMDQFGLPILLGGCKPAFTTEGKRIPHVLPLVFDPRDEDLSSLWNHGLKQMFAMPKNAIGTCIRQENETLFLLYPKKSGGSFCGEVEYKNIVFSVPRSTGLVIYRAKEKGQIKQLL
jgi:hypothetical protein